MNSRGTCRHGNRDGAGQSKGAGKGGHAAADTLTCMMTSAHDLRLTSERHPLIHFHPLREHAGLSLSTQ